ncbi:hypothetical protein [Actinoplanes rectilineatus]|uniref:hypothetical protein n=1 Tax=Actinoplanes rectilineatus TaxID=113571 RepID=UPI000A8D10DD|nr:hypothetical protein [Actinoplanes rectilineatus]
MRSGGVDELRQHFASIVEAEWGPWEMRALLRASRARARRQRLLFAVQVAGLALLAAVAGFLTGLSL